MGNRSVLVVRTWIEVRLVAQTRKTIRATRNLGDIAPTTVLHNAKESMKLGQYRYLIEHCRDEALDVAYQCVFQVFYGMNYRTAAWIEGYFEVFSQLKDMGEDLSFKQVLSALYDEDTGKVEASFASKMLATINPQKPILDSNVLYVLYACGEVSRRELTQRGQKRLVQAIDLYEEIEEAYRGLSEEMAQQWIAAFDAEFSGYADISDAKKIDFVLWSQGAQWKEEEKDEKEKEKARALAVLP